MGKGWIKIHRKLLDNDIWTQSGPFDDRSAWIDLILLANFKDGEMNIKRTRKKRIIKRGQRHTSRDELAKRWGWSLGKVDRYLDTLHERGMLDIDGTPYGTTLTLVNYGKYQSQVDTDETPYETDSETPYGTPNETPNGTRYKNDYKNDIKNIQEPKKAPASRIGFYDTELEE